MKKIFTFSLLVLSFVACTTNEEISGEKESLDSSLKREYDAVQTSVRQALSQTMSEMDGCESRSETAQLSGAEFIQFLTELSSEKADSLYAEFCTPAASERYDALQDALYEALIAASSEAEVDALYEFIDQYIEIGGHNMEMILQSSNGMSSIIKACMLRGAAAIDVFMGDAHYSRSSFCRDQLIIALARTSADIMGELLIDDAFAALPEAEIASILIDIGVDAYKAAQLAYDYKKCERTYH